VFPDQLFATDRGRNLIKVFGLAAEQIEPLQNPLLIECYFDSSADCGRVKNFIDPSSNDRLLADCGAPLALYPKEMYASVGLMPLATI